MSMSRRKGVLNDRSGVSPVIGVILMVAVTVIVAAVIGATTLGMTDRVGERPPQAQFEVKQVDNHTVYDEERDDDIQFGAMIEIKHTNGEDVDKENIRVTVDGEPAHIATEKTEAEISNEDKYNYKKTSGTHNTLFSHNHGSIQRRFVPVTQPNLLQQDHISKTMV